MGFGGGLKFRVWGAGLRFTVLGFGFRGSGTSSNVQRFRGGLVFKAHRLCVSLNSRLESHKEEEEGERVHLAFRVQGVGCRV